MSSKLMKSGSLASERSLLDRTTVWEAVCWSEFRADVKAVLEDGG